MFKFVVPLIMASSLLSNSVYADALGVYVGGGVWDYDSSGTFGVNGGINSVIDVESDLGFDGDQEGYVWIAFEHFIPILPNVRFEAATISDAGSAGSLIFNGVSVSGDASFNLDNTDLILYYRILDNWVNFDLGINVRKLTGDFVIGSEAASVSETIPMLYVSAQFDLPLTGLSIGGDLSTVSVSGSKLQDMRLRLLYEIGVVGFELGYKTTVIELDDISNVDSDLTFEGMFLGGFLHF